MYGLNLKDPNWIPLTADKLIQTRSKIFIAGKIVERQINKVSGSVSVGPYMLYGNLIIPCHNIGYKIQCINLECSQNCCHMRFDIFKIIVKK